MNPSSSPYRFSIILDDTGRGNVQSFCFSDNPELKAACAVIASKIQDMLDETLVERRAIMERAERAIVECMVTGNATFRVSS